MLQSSAWLTREIRLSGDLAATIAYNARVSVLVPHVGGGTVTIDGEKHYEVVGPRYTNAVSASFPVGDPPRVCELRAELSFGVLSRILSLELALEDQILYHEIDGVIRTQRASPDLPLPAQAPSGVTDELPIPADSPGVGD